MPVTVNINNSQFDHGSNVIGTVNENIQPEKNQAILNELQAIRKELESAQALSDSIAALEDAIRQQDNLKIKTVIGSLTTSFSSALMANLASNGLLAFLGIH